MPSILAPIGQAIAGVFGHQSTGPLAGMVAGHAPVSSQAMPPSFPATSSPYDPKHAKRTFSPQSPIQGLPSMGFPGPVATSARYMSGKPSSDSLPSSATTAPSSAHTQYPSQEFDPNIQYHGTPDIYRMNPGTPATGHPIPSPGAGQPPKRAYRQRRKDPSCDACRERKVKCDATDTSSCSECSSRNVKCQFTKETNRRMSSIKQVQDLEKQLSAARQQVLQLKTLVKGDGFEQTPRDYSPITTSPGNDAGPNKRRKLTKSHDYSAVAQNMEKYGQGLLTNRKIEVSPLQKRPPNVTFPASLPTRPQGDALLQAYYLTFHPFHQILDWTSFSKQYDQAYANGGLYNSAPGFAALLFAVLACGSLRDRDPVGADFLEASKSMCGSISDDWSVDHIRASVLLGTFLCEMNAKVAAWSTIGSAVRVAQMLGLHKKDTHPVSSEAQLRENLWWILHVHDRLLSLELSRPSIIADEDCDIDPPILRTSHITHGLLYQQPSPSDVALMVQSTRCTQNLIQAFRQPVISRQSLQTVCHEMDRVIATFPSQHQISSQEYLDPKTITPLMIMQNNRFLLYRHNLSPSSPQEARLAALDQCFDVARMTANFLARATGQAFSPVANSPLPPHYNNTTTIPPCTFVLTHIWRCILILTFRGDYNSAMICARVSAGTGRLRPINMACGQYLECFIQKLIEKINQRLDQTTLDRDEDLIAFVSGDLQNSLEQSWVWRDLPVHSLSYRSSPGTMSSLSTPLDPEQWDGWDRVVAMIRRLAEGPRDALGPPGRLPEPLRSPGESGRLPSLTSPGPDPRTSPSSGFGGSRISIADII